MAAPNQHPQPEHPRVRALILVTLVALLIVVLAVSGLG